MLPEAPPGDAGLSLGLKREHGAGARPPRPRRAGCDWVLVGIPGVVALVLPEYLRRQPAAPELSPWSAWRALVT